MSLIPQVPATVGYGTAFVFGWLVHRSRPALEAITRGWLLYLIIGLIATAWLWHVIHQTPMAQPGLLKNSFAYAVRRRGLGLDRSASPAPRCASSPTTAPCAATSPTPRTGSTSCTCRWWRRCRSGWATGRCTGPSNIRSSCVVSFAVLFASYHLLVRSTPIGLLLNGRRYPWRRPSGDLTAPPSPGSPPPEPSGTDGADPVAELRGVTKKFGAVTALSAIDIEVRAGELLAVLGPNGAGKSTAISLWLGLQEADSGEVRLLGGSPQDIDRRQGLGVMLQDVELPKELRVRELVRLAASYYSDPLPVEETLRRAGVTAFAHRPYGKLSGGQKRLAQFAIAICGQPRVLFLDEPSVGLDVQAREALWNSIRACWPPAAPSC